MKLEAAEGRDELVEALRRFDIPNPDPEMVDGAVAARLVRMVDRLRAVGVRVEEEPAVVVVAVLGPRAGLAVAPVARGQAGAPELVDDVARSGRDADVEASRHRLPEARSHERPVVPLDEVVSVVGRLDPQRRKYGVVEGLRSLSVGGADADVVEDAANMPESGRR